jgi:hypothetical protein
MILFLEMKRTGESDGTGSKRMGQMEDIIKIFFQIRL